MPTTGVRGVESTATMKQKELAFKMGVDMVTGTKP